MPNLAQIAARRKGMPPKRMPTSTAIAVTLPAPVGGWNARDSLAAMDEEDAVFLMNFFPAPTFVEVRNGYTPWVANLSGYVETLMAYSGSTNDKLFAATSAGIIYNITQEDELLTTESGDFITTESDDLLIVEASSTSEDVTGLTNGRWQYTNITTAAGNYLRAVNGADYSRVYTGSAWHADGDGAPYDITGVDSRTLIGINLHKFRLWFVELGTLKAWYLPSGALGGAAVAFDLSAVARRGGYLMAMNTWTIDAGYGLDDLAVWITSNGEVIVYRGTDPSSASTWALVGIYDIGSPVGRRCFFKWTGDLLAITQDGVVPLSGALQSSRTNPRVAITDKIQSAVSDAVSLYDSNFGWQLIYLAQANQLYLNVPIYERHDQQQYVMNTITKAWCNFEGWDAGCWEIFNDRLYFGSFGFVGQAWDGTDDAGVAIETNALQAFNYLGDPGVQKRVTMFQPIFYTTGTPQVFGGVNVDFDTSVNTGQLQVEASRFALWDQASWDSGIWGPDLDLRKAWNGAQGVGNAFAPTLNTSTNGVTLQWVNSNLVYEKGGIL